jgi:hypothetical protein
LGGSNGQEIRRIGVPQGNVCSLAFAPDGRTLASGGEDSTILLWDLTGEPPRAKLNPAALTAGELEALWSDLAGQAVEADRALWTLALSPKQSMPLLKKHLQVVPAPADQVAKLVANLDSERFAVRQEAAQALEKLGEAAEGTVRKILQGKPTLEVKQRLEQFLEKQSKEVVRKLRAIEAVEQIATPEAQQLLAELAQGAPNPRVAQAATAALQRLAQRRS